MSAECQTCGADLVGYGNDMYCEECKLRAEIEQLRRELAEANERYSQAAESYAGICRTLAESGEKRQQLEQELAAARRERDALLACRHGDQRCHECPDTACCDNMKLSGNWEV